MSEITYYQTNRDVMLDRAKQYYQNNKKILRENAKNKYRDLSDKEKNIKSEYGKNRCLNMSEERNKN